MARSRRQIPIGPKSYDCTARALSIRVRIQRPWNQPDSEAGWKTELEVLIDSSRFLLVPSG